MIINLPSTFLIGGVHTNLHWLIQYFNMHPNTYVGKDIGANFFANDQLYKKGVSELYKGFIHSNSNQVKIEIAPNYLYYGDKVIPRLKALYNKDVKDLKFIVYLDNPLERMLSEYQFNVEQGVENLSLGKAIVRENTLKLIPEYCNSGNTCGLYSANSLYAEQLKVWMSEFGENQFLFVGESDKTKSTVSRFLDLKNEEANIPSIDLGQKTVKLLSSYFKSKQEKERQGIIKTIPNSLFGDFEKDIKTLENITRMDFSCWKSRSMAVI